MKLHEKALGGAASLSMIFVVVITIVAELNKPIKDFLQAMTGHHWVSKGVLAVLIFCLSYFAIRPLYKNDEFSMKDLIEILAVTIVGGILLLGFFVWHFMAR